ncbi:MAG: hypothetical protein H8E57_02215 [Candidatus Cloacimonetes bacterium]|nr:hypothetical protein [Candidatus Cloacimonadota bacterium]
MKTRFIILLLLTLSCISIFSQDDYEKWKLQQTADLEEFRSEQDKAFVEFLEKQWKSFDAFKGIVMDETPKPQEIPEAKLLRPKEYPKTNIIEDLIIPVEKLETTIDKTEIPKDIIDEKMADEKEKIEAEMPKEREKIAISKKPVQNNIEITFWGLPLEFSYKNQTKISIQNPIDEKTIADFWYHISNAEYRPLISQLKKYKSKLRLNDWGYCQLINEVGKKISNNSQRYTNLFVWFILVKSGFDAKVGYNPQDIHLLLPSANVIYGNSYLKSEGKRYYIISFDKRIRKAFSIKTYDGKYPDANAIIDLNILQSPNFANSYVERELKFHYDGIEYLIPIKYEKNTAEYFKNYPNTEMEIYFNAPLSSDAKNSLTTEFRNVLVGKSEAEAVNIILRFVQTAFEYKTDREQFGMEKSFFSDETIFYPFCDCEDRSILFSFLVRNLVGLDVVGLDYPGHIATAVKFHSALEGDFVMYKNEKYIICDPTYINADLGMAIPQYKSIQPDIIALK